jgi:RimJ/RimL family protein N-acetyltransferase
MRSLKTLIRYLLEETISNRILVKPSELDEDNLLRLKDYLDAADDHPEFRGYDLVKGKHRDALRLAILDDEGNVIGFMTPRLDRGYWRTGAIYTDPKVRGSGYALRAIKEFFSDSSHRPARIWISDENKRSQNAFIGAGFEMGEKRDMGDNPEDKGHYYNLK